MANHSEKGISPEESIVYSFRELAIAKNIRAIDLIATLRDYATSGSAIRGDVVNSILERVELNKLQLAEIKLAALEGAIIQYGQIKTYLGENEQTAALREVGQYVQVASFAQEQLDRRPQ